MIILHSFISTLFRIKLYTCLIQYVTVLQYIRYLTTTIDMQSVCGGTCRGRFLSFFYFLNPLDPSTLPVFTPFDFNLTHLSFIILFLALVRVSLTATIFDKTDDISFLLYVRLWDSYTTT